MIVNPLIDANFFMEPHGMIQARADNFMGSKINRVRADGCAHQSFIGYESEQRSMRNWVVANGVIEFKPESVSGFKLAGHDGGLQTRGSHFQNIGSEGQVIASKVGFGEADQSANFRRAVIIILEVAVMLNIFRKIELMLIAFFNNLKANRGVENRFAALLADDASRGKTAAVSNGVDLIDNGPRQIAGAQKIGMQGMRLALGLNRSHSRVQRLPNDLPAKNTGQAHFQSLTAKEQCVEFLHMHFCQKFIACKHAGRIAVMPTKINHQLGISQNVPMYEWQGET